MVVIGRSIYREWSQARAAGGVLAVCNVQFKYSVVAVLAGLLMVIFTGGPDPASDTRSGLVLMLVGASCVLYDYCRGKSLARKSGLSFPTLK